MTNIEWVQFVIDSLNIELSFYKEKIQENDIVDMQRKYYIEMSRNQETYINYLKQIKIKLEKYEIIKDKISFTEYYDSEEDYENDINSHKALCLNTNLKIQNSNNEDEWFIPLTEEESKKLEVLND